MTLDVCRSPPLVQLDLCVFSLLFSRSLAFDYADVAACFVFFYLWFLIIHYTSPAHMCADAYPDGAQIALSKTFVDEGLGQYQESRHCVSDLSCRV